MANILLKKKTFFWFLMGLVVITGLISLFSLPRESMPEIKIPIVGVTTVYPGASSFDVEELVTEPLEKQFLRSLKNVDSIQSTSSEGISTIIINFETNVDIKNAILDVRSEIEKVKDLPSDVLDPVASEFSFSDMPIFIVSLSSSEAYTQLSDTVKKIEDLFLGISGVSKVQIDGIPQREITIILDKTKLSEYNLSPSQVSQKISQSNFSIPAGSMVQSGVEYSIRIDNNLDTLNKLENIIIKSLGQGKYLYVKDIATIEDGLAPYNSLSRLSVQGHEMSQAVTFSIYKQVDADITKVASGARNILKDIQKEYPNTEFVTLVDYGQDISDSISSLSFSALQTVFLVVLILSIALGIGASAVTAITVPISFLMAFIGLQYAGISLNFISLFALILSVGLLVDASIVIIEGITLFKDKGLSTEEAIKNTLKEYAQPVIAGNLTTIVVFVPMIFMGGIIGEFIKSIPMTIMLVLLASLIVALVFVPLISTFKRKTTSKKYKWIENLDQKRELYFEKINSWYERVLRGIVSKKKKSKRLVTAIILAFILSLILLGVGVIKSEFFPEDEFKQINVSMTLPQGSQLSFADQSFVEMENYLRELDYVDSFVTKVYPEKGEITILLKDEKYGNRALTEIRNKIAELPKKQAVFKASSVSSGGPSSGAPVSIRLTGDDYDNVIITSLEVEDVLRSIPGTVDVSSSVSDSSMNIVLDLQHERLIEAGLDPFTVGGIIRTSLFGVEATTIKRSGQDISVMVKTAVNDEYFKSSETNNISIDQLRSIPIPTMSGSVPLGTFITEKVIANNPSIERIDGDRVVNITSQLKDGYVLSDITVPLIQALNQMEMPEGISWSFGGDVESSAESAMDLLKAMFLGLALMLAVLVYQFNSMKKTFLILSVIPLGLIGVLLGLIVFNQPLSFVSMLGFVTLSALVVNNSIILVDVFEKIEDRTDLRGADLVVAGSVQRLRPILLTTATTVIGMIPLLFTSPMWQPLAVAIIFGLSFATIITLVIIPILYSWWWAKE